MGTDTAAARSVAAGYRLVQAAAHLHRVVDPSGRVIGHVADHEVDGVRRVIARRFHAATGAFVDVGAFWDVNDAVTALHHSR